MTSDERPFFGGELTDFSNAFPNVEKLELTIEREERVPVGLGCDWSKHTYNETNVPNHIPCSNFRPPCLRGGFNIERLLRSLESRRKPGENELVLDTQYLFCEGDHGSPGGRRKGPRCNITFKVSAKLIFRPD